MLGTRACCWYFYIWHQSPTLALENISWAFILSFKGGLHDSMMDISMHIFHVTYEAWGVLHTIGILEIWPPYLLLNL